MHESHGADVEEASVLDYVAVLVLIPITIFGMYSSFLVFGGLFGTVLETEGAIRFWGAIGLSSVLPFVVAASAFTQHSAPLFSQRLQRLLSIILALSVGSAMLVGIFLTAKVVDPMHTDPNWFMANRDTNVGLAGKNRTYSAKLAGGIETIADKAGFYHKPR
jgi:hypothetical protein